MRWTAAWIAPEVASKQRDVWQSLASQVLAGKDREMIVAVEALAAFDRGQAAEAAALVGKANIPSVQLQMLRAVLLKRAGQDREALNEFQASLVAASDSSAMAAFGFSEDELRWQLVRLFARLDQPRAALKLANADERLRGVAEVEELKPSSARLLTLQIRTTQRQRQSRLELLALLSASAERIGEFDKAADFELARTALLSGEERRKAEARVEQLKARQKEKVNKRGLALAVDERPVTAR